MKNSLAWHKECHANRLSHLFGLRRDVERKTAELMDAERGIAFHAEQIAEAERRGMADFDEERLLVKRKRT